MYYLIAVHHVSGVSNNAQKSTKVKKCFGPSNKYECTRNRDNTLQLWCKRVWNVRL